MVHLLMSYYALMHKHVCVCLPPAEKHLGSRLITPAALTASSRFFVFFFCPELLVRDAPLSASEGCPVDWLVMGHKDLTCAHTHIPVWGCASHLSWEAAGFGFIACIDRGSGCVKGSICGLKGGVNSSVLHHKPPQLSDTFQTQHLQRPEK